MIRRKMLVKLTILAISLAPASAYAKQWGVVAPPDWTADPNDTPITNVIIDTWLTENGITITQGVLIGPIQAGETRDIDASAFDHSGRTICINANVELDNNVSTRVSAVPVCHLFPAPILLPVTLLPPR